MMFKITVRREMIDEYHVQASSPEAAREGLRTGKQSPNNSYKYISTIEDVSTIDDISESSNVQ